MNANNTPKKATIDWHKEDIVAALHKKGWSIRQLSFQHGYKHGSALRGALERSWPKGEKIIADAIGVSVETIWPNRVAHRNRKKIANNNLNS